MSDHERVALAPFLEEALDADSRDLTVEGTDSAPAGEAPARHGVVPALSSLFAR